MYTLENFYKSEAIINRQELAKRTILANIQNISFEDLKNLCSAISDKYIKIVELEKDMQVLRNLIPYLLENYDFNDDLKRYKVLIFSSKKNKISEFLATEYGTSEDEINQKLKNKKYYYNDFFICAAKKIEILDFITIN